MAAESVTQDRIYIAIKAEYLSGLIRPGARIELQPIADRHRASTTPVREAMHRMIGERLIEPHPDGGFRLVTPDALPLAHLYTWYCQQVLAALHLLRNASLARALERFRGTVIPSEPLPQAERCDRVFQEIANATGNAEIIEQMAAANERLRYPRLAEARLFPNLSKELENLTRNGNLSGIANVRRRVTAFHDRRILHATEIASTLRAADDRGPLV